MPFGDVEGAIAHRGFAKASSVILARLRPVLLEGLAANTGYRVVIAGHSLGAGVTALLTRLILDEGGPMADGLVAVAIAPPPCFAPLSAMDDAWASALHSFILADDLVPRISMFSLRNLLLHTRHIDQQRVKASELERMDVKELLMRFPDHGGSVFGTSEMRPGSGVDCEECSAAVRESARDVDSSLCREENTGMPPTRICNRLAAVFQKSSSQHDESNGSLQEDADTAAQVHHRHLLRFRHHHRADMAEIHRTLVPATKGVHWLVDAALHVEGHETFDKASGRSGFARHLQKLRISKKGSSDSHETESAAAGSIRNNGVGVGGDAAKSGFMLVNLPADSFHSMFLTPGCMSSHRIEAYQSAIDALVTCDICDPESR